MFPPCRRRTGLVHGASTSLSTRTSRRGLDVDWIEAWAITEELLAMFRNDVTSRNAHSILATLSTDIQVHPDRRIRAAFQRQVGTYSLFHSLRRVDVDGRKVKSASPSPPSTTSPMQSAVHLSYGPVASFRVRFLPFREQTRFGQQERTALRPSSLAR